MKYLDKVKKDLLKMLRIYNVSKNYGRGNMFLVEEIITVVNVGVSGLRT